MPTLCIQVAQKIEETKMAKTKRCLIEKNLIVLRRKIVVGIMWDINDKLFNQFKIFKWFCETN